jgi:hypothetical protein
MHYNSIARLLVAWPAGLLKAPPAERARRASNIQSLAVKGARATAVCGKVTRARVVAMLCSETSLSPPGL